MNDFLNSEKHLFNHINDTSGCIDGINGGTLVTNKFIKYMNTKFSFGVNISKLAWII